LPLAVPNLMIALRETKNEIFAESQLTITSITYPFVDLIRFISMIGIVWAHVSVYPITNSGSYELVSDDYMVAFIPYKQVFKFAVLCFFMISGFLLGDKISAVNPVSYFKRRFNSTIKPYMVAFCMFIALELVRIHILNKHVTHSDSIIDILRFCLFETFFWYLPNYLICLAIILVFKRYLKSLYLGASLLCITLLYAAFTVYTTTYSVGHTQVVFAYVFYLWLGTYIRQKNLVPYIYKFNIYYVLAAVVLLFVISSVESYWLYKHNLNYLSILRIFNQLYAVAMFVLLVKLGSKKRTFGPFHPRKESYGIYLYHGFFIYFIFPKAVIMANEYLGLQIWSTNTWIRLLLMTAYAVICYLTTALFTKILLNLKLAYL
jgi:peptidoglycan/LPS O-acetylase OafA/YrhL